MQSYNSHRRYTYEGPMVRRMSAILLLAVTLLIAGGLLVTHAETQGSIPTWPTSSRQPIAAARVP